MLRPGDVQILDLAQPNITAAKASGTIAIVVPRDTLRRALPTAGDLHGLVLRGDSGTGGLLADYMRSLVARADAITMADAPLIAQATTDMIAACFHTTAETVERARTAIEMTMLERIQRHISTRLNLSDLHAEALCGLLASRGRSSTGCSNRWAASQATYRSSGWAVPMRNCPIPRATTAEYTKLPLASAFQAKPISAASSARRSGSVQATCARAPTPCSPLAAGRPQPVRQKAAMKIGSAS